MRKLLGNKKIVEVAYDLFSLVAVIGLNKLVTDHNFEQEHCPRCNREGEVRTSTSNAGCYRWWCRLCGIIWVTEGSPMDIANQIILSNTPDHEPDINQGIIDSIVAHDFKQTSLKIIQSIPPVKK